MELRSRSGGREPPAKDVSARRAFGLSGGQKRQVQETIDLPPGLIGLFVRFLVLVLSIAAPVLVLDRSRRYRIRPLNQLRQHRNDPFQFCLANPIQFRIDHLATKRVYRESQSIPKPNHAQSRKTDSSFSDIASHYPRQC